MYRLWFWWRDSVDLHTKVKVSKNSEQEITEPRTNTSGGGIGKIDIADGRIAVGSVTGSSVNTAGNFYGEKKGHPDLP